MGGLWQAWLEEAAHQDLYKACGLRSPPKLRWLTYWFVLEARKPTIPIVARMPFAWSLHAS